MTADWSAPIGADAAYRRAAGRRAFNARRQFAAAERRAQVARRLAAYGMGRGVRARIAQELQVHPSTVGRDLRRSFDPSLADNREEQRGFR
jgi:hypothetical protein